MTSPRSIYEYMGNKKWLSVAEQEKDHGQIVIEGMEQPDGIMDLDERYTTPSTLQWCMAKAEVSGFDLDVAACAEAHCAEHWMDKAVDGLKQRWWGRVWCNPPYSDIAPWVEKAWKEISAIGGGADRIAMLLPATRTEQPWWQVMVEERRDNWHMDPPRLWTYFIPGRVKFGHPGNPEGKGVGSPPFGCVLLVWRRQ